MVFLWEHTPPSSISYTHNMKMFPLVTTYNPLSLSVVPLDRLYLPAETLWCKILACAVTSTLPELSGCRAGGVSIPLTRAKCLVSDPSSQWSMKRISELPFPGLIQSGRGRQNVKLVFKKTPLPSFWKPKFFITLHLSTEIRIYFLLFLSNIKINAEVRRIPWGKETPSFKSALVIPPPHFFSISACYAFYY